MLTGRAVFLLLISLVTIAETAVAQSAAAVHDVQRGGKPVTAGVSAGNDWAIGTQIGYKFAGEGEFADAVLLNSELIYDIPMSGSPRYHLPVIANVGALVGDVADEQLGDQIKKSAQALLTSAQGMHFGVYPYLQEMAIGKSGNFAWIPHAVVSAKLNTLPNQDTSKSAVTILQGRFSIGGDVLIGKNEEGSHRLSLSAALTQLVFSASDYEQVFAERRSGITQLELTSILPFRKGAAVLMEGNMARRHSPVLRFGVLFVPGGDGEDDGIGDGGTGTTEDEGEPERLDTLRHLLRLR